MADKAKSGELKITKPTAPVQKKGRWDETPKIEALGAGALTPSQTPGSTQRKRLTLTSNISAAAAEVSIEKSFQVHVTLWKISAKSMNCLGCNSTCCPLG